MVRCSAVPGPTRRAARGQREVLVTCGETGRAVWGETIYSTNFTQKMRQFEVRGDFHLTFYWIKTRQEADSAQLPKLFSFSTCFVLAKRASVFMCCAGGHSGSQTPHADTRSIMLYSQRETNLLKRE